MIEFAAELDIDDFLDEFTNCSSKPFLKRDQLVCYLYEGNVKKACFPIASEGNVIFSEEWKVKSSSERKKFRNFRVNIITSTLYCPSLLEGLSGDLRLSFGKCL